ncbi:MAG TPA: L,D-transpeptidase family protein [Verrucomicrobiae bacterium]|nr:L,D-transpeptidase family protein [Verrucomicrobiae bacterium]
MAAAHAQQPTTGVPEATIPGPSLGTAAIEKFLRDAPGALTNDAIVSDAVTRFYAGRKNEPAWGADGAAAKFLEAIGRVGDLGLNPKNYLPADFDAAAPTSVPETIARRDITLTTAFFEIAHDIRVGRARPPADPPSAQWQPAVPDLVPELESALANGDFAGRLASMEPTWDGYVALKAALKRYRDIAATGGWPDVPNIGRSLRIGSRGSAVVALRRRLAAEEDLPARLAPRKGEEPAGWHERFDGALDNAVRQFQARHELQVDGIVGPMTRGALNESVGERILQVRINLERWRWGERQPPERGLVVLLPQRELIAYERRRPAFRMRVNHGHALRDLAGDSFADKLEYLEFAPSWSVPPHVATGEILPKARKDPAWFQAQGFEIVSDYHPGAVIHPPDEASFDQVQAGKLFLRQKPGRDNPLGQVKFMVPNYFAIYLHGREKDPGFETTTLDIGRGWIRVEEPQKLATFVLAKESSWDARRVRKAMDSTKSERAPLSQPLPVIILCRDIYVDDAGHLQFRLVPERDAQIAKAAGFSAKDP